MTCSIFIVTVYVLQLPGARAIVVVWTSVVVGSVVVVVVVTVIVVLADEAMVVSERDIIIQLY